MPAPLFVQQSTEKGHIAPLLFILLALCLQKHLSSCSRHLLLFASI